MIHNREQLIAWLTQAAKEDVLLHKALMDSGTRVELLGRFDPLPGSSNPGWLIRVVTLFGREDLVAVVRDYLDRPVRFFFTDHITWETWEGPDDDVLIGGDNNGKEVKTTKRFDRIKRCAALYTEEGGSGSDNKNSEQMDKGRSAVKNVSHSKPPRVP